VSSTYNRERTLAIRAVRDAAALCRSVRGRHGPETLSKSDASPVTVADFGSQALICATLAEAFPNDPVIGEEDAEALREPKNARTRELVVEEVGRIRTGASADQVLAWIDHGNAEAYSKRFWTLDPIDGTKGFLRGEQYAIALALIVGGEIEVAALACPNLPLSSVSGGPIGAVFAAVRGRGAVILAIDAEKDQSVRVSDQSDPKRARFCESVESGHSAHNESALVAARLGITEAPVRIDSQAKYATVASGRAEIYLRLPTRADYQEKIWDHAAGALLVTEAGGRVSDIEGRPLDFTQGRTLSRNTGIVATNGRIHDAVLEALRAP